MSGPFGSSQWMYSSGGAFYDTEIDGSLRFNDNDSAYLSGGVGGTVSTYTVSYWFKRSTVTSSQYQYMFSTRSNGGISIGSTAGQVDEIYVYNAGGGDVQYIGSGRKFRDPSAWYHLVMKVSSGSATVYINGEQLGTATAGSVNTGAQIGKYGGSNDFYWDGYIADFHFIDGSALNPTSFGETKSGVWIPKAYSGSYGTNGFHLEFAGNVNDSSGNGNNWTANNISSYDYVPDSPTNNFCTYNPLIINRGLTLSQGNLFGSMGSGDAQTGGTIGVSSGKWYYEVRNHSGGGDGMCVGFYDTTTGEWDIRLNNSSSGPVDFVVLGSGGGNQVRFGNVSQGTVSDHGSQGDIRQVRLDLDSSPQTIGFAENGGSWTDFNLPSSTRTRIFSPVLFDISNSTYTAWANFGQDSTFGGNTTAGGNSDANGIGDFKYSVPSGYLALCTANLTIAEAVDPALDNSPQDYFNTVLWTGNGASTIDITGVGFQPDFVWAKARSRVDGHGLFDVIRGTNQWLQSNTTGAETDFGGNFGLLSFDSDGYQMGNGTSVNASGATYVGWNWKANGSGVSNTDGSNTTTVSANQDAGFSIVTGTKTGGATVAKTFGHGLGKKPQFIMQKRTDGTEEWYGYIEPITAFYRMGFNSTSGQTSTNVWHDTEPTDSVFTIRAFNDGDFVAYCFTSIEGFSKIGSYTGNGSADGPFVYTGFRPAFVLVKASSVSGESWAIIDDERLGYNVTNSYLIANASSAEFAYGGGGADMLSNGFKLRSTSGGLNTSGATFIYMAFAENPFKYANAR